MALVYKTINLWAFRDNNIHILCFGNENLGKEIRFKLLNSDGATVALDKSVAINFYWTPDGSDASYYIAGSIANANDGTVAIPITKEICSAQGRISCVLEINKGGDTTKFGSIEIDVINGIGDVEVSILNPAQYDLVMSMQGDVTLLKKKLEELAKNNDPNAEIVEAKGISSTLKKKISNYDTFAMFPNQTVNIMKNNKNFESTDNWDFVNTGELSATGYSLKAVSEDNFGIYGTLEKDVSLTYNKTILVKARVRCLSGTSCTVTPCWRKSKNGVLIPLEYISAGNMDTSTSNSSVSWNLPTGKLWRDIWFIAFDGGSNTTINQIGLFITSGTTIEIAHFEVYYSQDSGLTDGELTDLQADVTQNKSDIDDLQTDVNGTKDSAGLKTRMNSAEGNITALQDAAKQSGKDISELKSETLNLSDVIYDNLHENKFDDWEAGYILSSGKNSSGPSSTDGKYFIRTSGYHRFKGAKSLTINIADGYRYNFAEYVKNDDGTYTKFYFTATSENNHTYEIDDTHYYRFAVSDCISTESSISFADGFHVFSKFDWKKLIINNFGPHYAPVLIGRKINRVKPTVCFIDDDGKTSVFTTTQPLFEAAGLPFTIACTSASEITGDDYSAKLSDFIASGGEIAQHALGNDQDLTTKSWSEINAWMEQEQGYWYNRGVSVRNIVYGGSKFSDVLCDLSSKHYDCGCTIRSSSMSDYINDTGHDIYKLSRVSTKSVSLATLKSKVDSIVTAGTGLLIFYSHSWELETSSDLVANLTELIAYVKSYVDAGTLKCCTLSNAFIN